MIVRNYQRPDPALIALIGHSIAKLADRHAVPIAPELDPIEITAPPIGISAVIGWTSFEMGLHVSAITGISREARLVRARAAIAWVSTVGLGRSLNQIGVLLGDRHHTTILSLLRKAESMRGRDPAFALLTTRLLDRIEQAGGLQAREARA